MSSSIPQFADLPLDKDGPHHNAWGLYGSDDELGTLNRLSDAIVAAAAAAEIRTGTRINLDAPLDVQADIPFFGRQPFAQHAYQKPPRIVNDDVWTFNTQSSSQWDGLRHFGYQKEAVFYNGVTLADIHGHDDGSSKEEQHEEKAGPREGKGNTRPSSILGVGAWASRGGIVGRGVLLDYHGWRQARGISHDAFASTAISAATLRQVAADQGTEIRFGDILLIRSGYWDAYKRLSRAELEAVRQRPQQPPPFAGVEQSEEMMEFLWTNFAAAGGDHPAFEVWPPQKEWALHEVMLAGWGMPIGELFDLEALAAHCKQTGRWSFFLVSQPVNVPGGVATPPNMVALF